VAELVYPPVVTLARGVFRALGLRFTVLGSEHVPRRGGAVMVCNHVGYLDFTFVGLAARPAGRLVRFMAKSEVFAHPVVGPLMRGMHHIPVDREAGALSYEVALRALRSGEIVGVFPEATISRSFELKNFKSGAARMAIDAGVPLLPTVVWGSQRVLTKGRPRNLRRQHIPIVIAVGEAIPTAAADDPVKVNNQLKARMTELLGRAQLLYPDTPRGDDDGWWLPARLGGTAPSVEEATRIDREELIARRAQRAAARQAGTGTGTG